MSLQPQQLRKMPVQDIIINLHLENGGLACYKAVQIWDLEKMNSSESLFCGILFSTYLQDYLWVVHWEQLALSVIVKLLALALTNLVLSLVNLVTTLTKHHLVTNLTKPSLDINGPGVDTIFRKPTNHPPTQRNFFRHFQGSKWVGEKILRKNLWLWTTFVF